jgi:hypothetical protein
MNQSYKLDQDHQHKNLKVTVFHNGLCDISNRFLNVNLSTKCETSKLNRESNGVRIRLICNFSNRS